MVITDFDGIFTDNSVIINADMSISRKINFKDVMGVSLLVKNGIDVAIISGEKNSAIELFAQKFNLKEIHMDIRNKLEVLQGILKRNNLSKENVIYIGDDINDMECLNFVPFGVTVPNANKKILALENLQVTETSGGDGAFREVADCILNI